jgi:hypothetical protein
MATVEYLSHSSLEDVRSCSLKYKLRKVDRVPQRPGWSLIGGNAVHSVTEAIDKRDFGIPVEPNMLDFHAQCSTTDRRGGARLGHAVTSEFYCAGRKSKENPNKEDEALVAQARAGHGAALGGLQARNQLADLDYPAG